MQFLALRFNHNLARQVNRQLVTGKSLRLVKQRVDLRLAQHNRQQPVFEAVVKENIRITWRNDRAKAVLIKGPRRMFPRRTTAKVLARKEYGRIFVTRLVQHKFRIWLAAGRVLPRMAWIQVSPGIKQIFPKPGFFDRL